MDFNPSFAIKIGNLCRASCGDPSFLGMTNCMIINFCRASCVISPFNRNDKTPQKKLSKRTALYLKRKSNSYFKPAKLCSIVAIFAKASASFCFSFANTFSGAPPTNFSFDNFA